jgi:hypothetical protein
MRRTGGLMLAVMAIVLSVASVGRADAKRTCLVAVDQGQILRTEGKLVDARQQFVACAAEECPALVRSECASWLAEVTGAIPTIVIAARAPDGRAASNVSVTLDGSPLSIVEPGAPVELDPGEHHLRFELAGAAPVEQTIVLPAGERSRRIDVSFVALAPPASSPMRPARDNRPGYILGAIGLVGLGSFATFALSGIDQRATLNDSCSPRCPHDDVDEVHRKLLVADISLGVGVVSLGLLAWWFFSRAHPESAAR